MKSVKTNTNTIIIKNSRFITLIYPINTKEEVEKYLKNAKITYPDATHYCYAYILDQTRKESDDGEPTGTAGIPILQVLEKQELNHVLCIVIRYFGKIKLGASGLVRAYTKSAATCIKEHIITLTEGYSLSFSFSYELSKKVDYLLNSSTITEKIFHTKITYQAIITKETLEILKKTTGIQINKISTTYLLEKDNKN